jgi:coenzyme F420-dependent glucose-6-phosphate dehydrogenase
MYSVAVSDHFQPWRHNVGHAPFPPACLAAVGNAPHESPVPLGGLYPGRVFLGLGTVEALNEIATGFRGNVSTSESASSE